ncbi:hypothetical protein [Streptomyces sp. RT42]|nr:hypothetical protein [Streptomyces sp. RT42]MBQ0876395.1 hypothetical protein [Streptomyces sp. RT42]
MKASDPIAYAASNGSEAVDLFPHPDENVMVIQQLLRARSLPDRPVQAR